MAKKTYQEGVKEGKRQLAERLLNTLAGTLGTTTDTQLASWLGVNQSSINHWRGGISSPQKDKLSVIIKSLLSCWVQPIYEMEPIEPVQAGAGWNLDRNSSKRTVLRTQLEGRRGVYIFFDSRGHITYIGQAKKEGKETSELYGEIEKRLIQELRHKMYSGTNTLAYTKIKAKNVIQGDVVRFISAYETVTGLAAHNIEALLIRVTRNSSQNRKSGTFNVGEWEA